jgi:hypothetical protein
MSGKIVTVSEIKQKIFEFSPELYKYIEHMSFDGKRFPMRTETIGGKKYTWSLAIEWGAEPGSVARPPNKQQQEKGDMAFKIRISQLDSLEQVAPKLLEELAHYEIHIAKISPNVAKKSDIFRAYQETIEDANLVKEQKRVIIEKLSQISGEAGTYPGNRAENAKALFKLLVEEKYVNDWVAIKTGGTVSDSDLAERYSRYEASAAEKNPYEGEVSERTELLLPELQDAVESLYREISLLEPDDKILGGGPPPKPALERVRPRSGPRRAGTDTNNEQQVAPNYLGGAASRPIRRRPLGGPVEGSGMSQTEIQSLATNPGLLHQKWPMLSPAQRMSMLNSGVFRSITGITDMSYAYKPQLGHIGQSGSPMHGGDPHHAGSGIHGPKHGGIHHGPKHGGIHRGPKHGGIHHGKTTHHTRPIVGPHHKTTPHFGHAPQGPHTIVGPVHGGHANSRPHDSAKHGRMLGVQALMDHKINTIPSPANPTSHVHHPIHHYHGPAVTVTGQLSRPCAATATIPGVGGMKIKCLGSGKL